MPKYVYKCGKCDIELTVVHMLNEAPTACLKCKSDESWERLPTSFNVKTAPICGCNPEAGELVHQTIEDTKREMREERERARRRIWEQK